MLDTFLSSCTKICSVNVEVGSPPEGVGEVEIPFIIDCMLSDIEYQLAVGR